MLGGGLNASFGGVEIVVAIAMRSMVEVAVYRMASFVSTTKQIEVSD